MARTLKLSSDNGKVFDKSLVLGDEVGKIKFSHIFTDGKLMFADHRKVYYSHDWSTYSVSTLYNISGQQFTTTQLLNNFSQNRSDFNTQTVSGVEMCVWGNYSLDGTGINVWYTVDKGINVKSAFKFGVSIPANNSGNPLSCNHCHNVCFNPADSSFWVLTGDEPTATNSHMLKGTYNTGTDTWTWTRIGSGDNYKATCIVWKDGYTYWCNDKVNGGVKKCADADIGTSANHSTILSLTNDCSGLIMSANSELIALVSRFNGTLDCRKFYYSPDMGANWHTITGTAPTNANGNANTSATFTNYGKLDTRGNCKVGIWDVNAGVEEENWQYLPSTYLSKFIREQGFPDAFR